MSHAAVRFQLLPEPIGLVALDSALPGGAVLAAAVITNGGSVLSTWGIAGVATTCGALGVDSVARALSSAPLSRVALP